MVLALIIQTLDSEEPELVYYRFYSAFLDVNFRPSTLCKRGDTPLRLYNTSIDKKKLLDHVINKVHMSYSLKLKQSLIPIQNQENKTVMKGCFFERNWCSTSFSVVWQGVPGIGFSLVGLEDENITQTQNVLEIITSQLQKYLQLVTYPAITTKVLDRVALIVDYFIPNGQLLFFNSSIVKNIEKQLELEIEH